MLRAEQLGRYHLLDRVAFGGMAEIYRAKTFDPDGHAHLVAVKRVLPHLAEDGDFVQMLVDEARFASLVRHANVAQVYEFSRAGGEYFLAMEYVDGKDTRAILERCRRHDRAVPPAHVAWIGAEIALALHAVHAVTDRQGQPVRLVHRDVSPSNVMCSYAGEVKLCDFGIAKGTLSSVHTRAGVIKGKIKYMSPEQALGRRLDHRSDLFSLGALMYELVTGTPPFDAPNELDLMVAVREAHVSPIRAVDPTIPPLLAGIIEKALARAREERWQGGDALAAALREFLAEHAPGYTRSHLAHFVRTLFADDIERELRLLEEYVVGAPDPGNVAVNLIADAVGLDAPWARFTPAPGTPRAPTAEPPGGRPAAVPAPAATARAATGTTAPPPAFARGRRRPPSDSEDDVPTTPKQRVELDELAAPPAATVDGRWPGSPGGRDPRTLDPAVHDAPTLIIRRRG